jgi:hypothetical protein
MNISIGSETAEPDEATVLRNPHASPATVARMSDHQS